MQYDPVKRSLGRVFNKAAWLRKLFYRLLDLLLLRAWYIKRQFRCIFKDRDSAPKILDAGCGYGQYDYFMSGRLKNAQILGVDVKQEQIDDCNQFFAQIGRGDRVKFRCADLTEFQEPDGYDLILSVDVMEHIEDDARVFGNFARSIKKGGVLLISTPSDKGGSDVHGDNEHSFIDEHVRDGYNIDDIRHKLTAAGFGSVEARYSYGKPGSVAWTLSMKWPITMLNISKLFFIILIPYYLIFYPICFVLNWIDAISQHDTGTGLIVKAIKN